jgi:hypothetical protein
MSDDLVNQITLNFLISKSQLHKLNNKIKQKEQDTMKSDKEIYKEQINELFTKCLNDEFPNDLLQDVRNSFTYFIEKSVYYLKLKANRSNEDDISAEEEEATEELSDNEKEAEEEEEEEEEAEEELSDNEKEEEEEELSDNEKEEEMVASLEVKPQRVYKKTSKPSHSEGVDDINKLPLDWFTKVKYQNQKQRQNQNLIEKKNITNVYEIKKNNK